VHEVAPDPLLAGLDEFQLAAVTSPAAPLAILAPAGSGKTRVLTRRIAWRAREGDLDPRRVLAVTFTRKAAGELAQRLRRLGVDGDVTAGTFHSLALAQLRKRAEETGREPPKVLDRKSRVLGRLLDVRGPRAGLAITEVASEIEWAKARMITPERFVDAALRAQRKLPRGADELADLYARYEHEKRRRRLVDFDDLLWWCAHFIETEAAFADSQRWRFRHFFVDEFQDASPLSVRLVAAWVGDRRDLCVVGDTAQAIYGFAGADAGFLDEFDRHFPGGERIELQYNYRSTPQVVRAAAAVLGRATRGTTAVRADGAVPTLVSYADDEAEAAGVGARLRDARARGLRWSDMAVLFRTNGQSAVFERVFDRMAVPYALSASERFLARPAAQAVLERLDLTERAAPRRPLRDHLSDLAAWADDDEPDDEQREVAATLVALGDEYLATEGGAGTLAGFLAWADVATSGDGAFVTSGGGGGGVGGGGGGGRGDRVALLTFHKAKGLEWPLVCVTGLEAGFVPISYATSDAELAEERRLLHVALSRAHDELHLSFARLRTFGERASERQRSPWVDAPAAASPPGPADRIPDPRVALEDVRRVLAAAKPPQPRSHAARRHTR
jgi:DNA helicase-2/ATP-dependent DNA helicase PcrA